MYHLYTLNECMYTSSTKNTDYKFEKYIRQRALKARFACMSRPQGPGPWSWPWAHPWGL